MGGLGEEARDAGRRGGRAGDGGRGRGAWEEGGGAFLRGRGLGGCAGLALGIRGRGLFVEDPAEGLEGQDGVRVRVGGVAGGGGELLEGWRHRAGEVGVGRRRGGAFRRGGTRVGGRAAAALGGEVRRAEVGRCGTLCADGPRARRRSCGGSSRQEGGEHRVRRRRRLGSPVCERGCRRGRRKVGR